MRKTAALEVVLEAIAMTHLRDADAIKKCTNLRGRHAVARHGGRGGHAYEGRRHKEL